MPIVFLESIRDVVVVDFYDEHEDLDHINNHAGNGRGCIIK